MVGDKQFILKLNLRSCSCRVWNFNEIPCSHAHVVLQMLNLDTYFYVFDYYHSQTSLSTYLGCVRPVGVHSNWRVVNDNIGALPPILNVHL